MSAQANGWVSGVAERFDLDTRFSGKKLHENKELTGAFGRTFMIRFCESAQTSLVFSSLFEQVYIDLE